ncbi:Eco57I restriction-modification methylase domain-containing protein [Clostridium cylindrosporum]|uniref:site-specific DNA-methyltransferase (adenine-specific) n=1 Tax=Clostridium cylindrosporum DSM 605 TaxID=1121307 RepID=A0A0J8D9R1_CLOCY|nr:N-6 DNA methylase [Clostridium cylindrosporum]KMT22582.1 hypothetical protein CLCY_9c00130 [Clostridium cylindrosporum DSM 605]
MLDLFVQDLESLYNDIKKFKEKEYIEKFKKRWKINKSIGEFYQGISLKESKKKSGSFYTPFDVVDYINSNISKNIKDKKEYEIKILDPSCGGGYFLIDIYIKLEKLLSDINFPMKEKFIIDKIIYGYDIDKVATLITIIELFYLSGYISENIFNKDFLFDNNDIKYNYILGNPPYIGHKVLEASYRKELSNFYGDVFYDKGDLSYCFIKKSIDLLVNGGHLVFFTSRYILESLYGREIRRFILDNCNINRIIDFYGVRIVKGAGVDNVILNFEKANYKNDTAEYFKINIEGKDKGAEVFNDIDKGLGKYTRHIKVNTSELNPEGWSFLSKEEKNIISKILNKCNVRLGDIADSFQGIITGKDEAFIIKKEDAKLHSIENDLLKPWIKGKQIIKFKVNSSDKLIVYSDIIKDEKDYPNTLKYLSFYKEILQKRRECVRGLRKWYNIQWGRKAELFEGKKIIFPYKSDSNRFSIDIGNFFSADIYSIVLKKEYEHYTYEYIESLLNSSVYEFYIKTIAKKLGDSLYEYYPNKIMNIFIPEVIKDICSIYNSSNTDINKIDNILGQYFGITEEEFKLIKLWCS